MVEEESEDDDEAGEFDDGDNLVDQAAVNKQRRTGQSDEEQEVSINLSREQSVAANASVNDCPDDEDRIISGPSAQVPNLTSPLQPRTDSDAHNLDDSTNIFGSSLLFPNSQGGHLSGQINRWFSTSCRN